MFRQHYEKMYNLARSILSDDDESKDVVSEVFTTILADDVVLMPESEEGFLMRSVRNRCLNLIAHKSVKERVAKLLLDDADVILSEETDERLDQLMLLIEDLEPPIRQLIFRLRYLQEKSYQEVADEVGVSKVTVFNHLSKAMDWIKEQLGRSAARDIYDVYNMVKHQLFVSDEKKTLLRKATVFYLTVGSSRKDNATPTEYTDFPQIDKIRFPQIRSQLLPVLRRSEHFDFEKAKTEVKDFLSKLLILTESEKEYVREFNDKKYIPELLFEDKEMVNRIKFHPMALWKTRSR